jgi:hypothetical protein
MSYNRLGALSAGLLGMGWLLAIAVQLIFWLPQTRGLDPSTWDDGRQVLFFVHENPITWRVFHIGTTGGLMGLVLLVPLLAEENKEDARWLALTAAGLVGATFALFASLIDHLGTPALARLSAGSGLTAHHIWEFMEPWRDAGLKTISYWFLGIWTLWLGGCWVGRGTHRLGRFSQFVGLALLILALIETVLPPPLIYTLGETGLGGMVFLLLPAWGLWTARWFWQRELAAVYGSSRDE